MDDALAMHVLGRVAEEHRDAKSFPGGQRPFSLQEIPEGLALDVLHREIGPAGVVDGESLQDAGMIQLSANLDFPLKA